MALVVFCIAEEFFELVDGEQDRAFSASSYRVEVLGLAVAHTQGVPVVVLPEALRDGLPVSGLVELREAIG